MTTARKLELLKVERECIERNRMKICDRDCRKCDLVQNDEELIELYDELINEYRKELWTERMDAREQEATYNRVNGIT